MHYSQTAVILFAYNRPKHFEATLKSALAELGGRGYKWYVFIDGPKFSSDDKPMLEILSASKRLLHQEDFDCKKQPVNIGLKASIILGVSDVFKRHEQAIVLEDDLVVKAGFGDFFAHAFEKYKDEKDIVQISGFSFIETDSDEAYTLPLTTSWGWGTWKNRWSRYISDIVNEDLRLTIKTLDKYKFNVEGSYKFSDILFKESRGKVSSWAILFYLYAFLNNARVIYPPFTLIENHGFDGSGTHGSSGVIEFEQRETFKERDILLPLIEYSELSDVMFRDVKIALSSLSRKSRWLRFIRGKVNVFSSK